MPRFMVRRAGTPSFPAWLVALAASLAGAAAAAAAPALEEKKTGIVKANPPVFFAYTRSDIQPDPGARFGTLANGMTYIIYKNATPPGTANVVMRVNAGSLMEREDQRGLAHFIEHMVFKGTTNVPEGEMAKILERNGLAFGADTNAYTANAETGYTLNLPNVRQETIDASLFLLREAASNVSFKPDALERERGVVLGEERFRDGVQARANDSLLKTLFAGQKYPERSPIGMTEVVRTAPPQALIDYYNNFYRPEYTTLVVVGDIDPDRIESDIKARFSDWKGKPQSQDALTDFGVYKNKGEVARTHVDKGLTDTISLTWVKPFKPQVETRALERQDMLFSLASGVLAKRFARQARQADAAFGGVWFYRRKFPYTAMAYQLDISPHPKQSRQAFEQVMATFRQFRARGVNQSELDRALLDQHSAYKASVQSQSTRDSGQIVFSLLGSLSSGSVPQTPAQKFAAFQAMEPKLTLEAVNAFIKHLQLGDGPIITRAAEDTSDFDRAQLLPAYHLAQQLSVSPYAEHQTVAWPYTHFGVPGQVVDRQTLHELGATRVTFANGVKLNVKSTQLEKDSIRVSVTLARGYLNLAPEKATVVAAANATGVEDGGLGKLKRDDMIDALNDKRVRASFVIGGNFSALDGSTRRADLATQMQLLMAVQTDAAFAPEALDRMKSNLPNRFVGKGASPSDVFSEKALPLLYRNDPFHRPATEQELRAVKNDDIKALVQGILATAPIEIAVVGDVSEDEVIKQVALTFGTLPKRPEAAPPVLSDAIRFPTEGLRQVFTHRGRADQNLSVIAWPTTDFYADPRQVVGLELLSSIMTQRELDEVRSRQGASYGASAVSMQSDVYRGFGYLASSAEVKPEGDDTYYETVRRIAEDLKSMPPTDDEMLRARRPMLERLANEPNRNGYWLSLLNGSIRDPQWLDYKRRERALLAAVTAEDVQTLAKTYLDMSKAMRVQVKAAGAGPTAASVNPANRAAASEAAR